MAHCLKRAHVSLKEIVSVVKHHANVSYGGAERDSSVLFNNANNNI